MVKLGPINTPTSRYTSTQYFFQERKELMRERSRFYLIRKTSKNQTEKIDNKGVRDYKKGSDQFIPNERAYCMLENIQKSADKNFDSSIRLTTRGLNNLLLRIESTIERLKSEIEHPPAPPKHYEAHTHIATLEVPEGGKLNTAIVRQYVSHLHEVSQAYEAEKKGQAQRTAAKVELIWGSGDYGPDAYKTEQRKSLFSLWRKKDPQGGSQSSLFRNSAQPKQASSREFSGAAEVEESKGSESEEGRRAQSEQNLPPIEQRPWWRRVFSPTNRVSPSEAKSESSEEKSRASSVEPRRNPFSLSFRRVGSVTPAPTSTLPKIERQATKIDDSSEVQVPEFDNSLLNKPRTEEI